MGSAEDWFSYSLRKICYFIYHSSQIHIINFTQWLKFLFQCCSNAKTSKNEFLGQSIMVKISCEYVNVQEPPKTILNHFIKKLELLAFEQSHS